MGGLAPASHRDRALQGGVFVLLCGQRLPQHAGRRRPQRRGEVLELMEEGSRG